MSSTNYYINWDSINIGGNDFSSSTNYYLHDTLGQTVSGKTTSTNYLLYGGYRVPDIGDRYIEFTISAQNNASQIDWTNFNNGGKQVTVSSTSGYAAGDYIVVVENEGASEKVTIGRIVSVGGGIITVDKWDGDNATISASPSGGDDWVYELSGDTIDLGTLLSISVSTGVSRTEVYTNAPDGYTVTIKENQNLSSGTDEINDVADGTVSAGAEEYGIKTTGSTAQGSGDWAITSTGQTVQSSSAAADHDRIAIIYKASKSAATTTGSYSHTVTFYVTADF